MSADAPLGGSSLPTPLSLITSIVTTIPSSRYQPLPTLRSKATVTSRSWRGCSGRDDLAGLGEVITADETKGMPDWIEIDAE